MRYGLLVLIAVLVETLVFAQLPIAGIVFPMTLLALIMIGRSTGLAQLMMYAAGAGLLLDSLRASTASPFWLLACLSTGLFIGLWRDVARDNIRSRVYLLRMYAPVLIVSSAIWAIVPNTSIIRTVNWGALLYEFVSFGLMLALSLLMILFIERRYGI